MPSLLERLRPRARRGSDDRCAVCEGPGEKWVERWVAQERYRLCCPTCVSQFDARPMLYAR
jgi:hypothetical protein